MMQTYYLGKQNAPICLLPLFIQAYCARRLFRLDNSTGSGITLRGRTRAPFSPKTLKNVIFFIVPFSKEFLKEELCTGVLVQQRRT